MTWGGGWPSARGARARSSGSRGAPRADGPPPSSGRRHQRQEASVPAWIVALGPPPAQVVAAHLRGVLVHAGTVAGSPDRGNARVPGIDDVRPGDLRVGEDAWVGVRLE